MLLVKKLFSHLEYLATEKPVALAGWIALVAAVVVIGASLPYWTHDFWGFLENVAVEAHGMIFDLLVIGWFILWLNKRAEKRLDIRRYEEEIDDYRHWEEAEASHRIAGSIRRLNKNGVTQINLSDCYLQGAVLNNAALIDSDLRRANLSYARLEGADLSGSDLTNAKLIRANLICAKFIGASLVGTNFVCASLIGSNLSHAILIAANLEKSDLSGSNLSQAHVSGNLINANLRRANLSYASLSYANLCNSIFSDANLRGADLSDTNFSGADLSGTILDDAILLRSDLSGSKELALSQITGSNPPLLCRTKLPVDMEHLANRDCDRIPQILLDRYPKRFETLEEAETQIKTSLNQED